MDGWIDWLSESLIWFIDLLIHGSIDPLYLQWRKSNRNFLAKSSVNNAKWLTTPLICHLYHQWGVINISYHIIFHEYHMLWICQSLWYFWGLHPIYISIYIYTYIYIYPIIPYKKNITFAPDWRSHPLPPCGFSGGVKKIGRDDDHFGWDDVHHEI